MYEEEKMKIDLVGNHCTWAEGLNTSYIINDNLLFDIPIGSFKTLNNKYDLSKIEHIIISHFHSDHFGDIFLAIEILVRLNHFVDILAPKDCKKRIEKLMRTMAIDHLIPYLDKFKFIDAENGKIVKMGKYKIKCFSVRHGSLDAYGYIIDDGTKVGFSGDSAMCNNIRKIAKSSKAMFIDASGVVEDQKHLSTFEIKTLSQEFPTTIFYPVHLSTASEKTLDDFKLIHTSQGQKIIVE